VSSSPAIELLGYIEIVFCIAALCAIVAKKQWSEYWSLGAFLAVKTASTATLAAILLFKASMGAHAAYSSYFYVYYISFAVESILGLTMIYGVFRLAMAPLKGLQTLGMLVFRWAAAISVAVAMGSAYNPQLGGRMYLVNAISELQRTQSILTLCLLLFVCFAIRPMGLNYGSRIFGVSLGLGFLATIELVQSAWLGHAPKMSNQATIVQGIISGSVMCATLIIWTAYFALPEPKRRIIVLPTTSPFLRWNQISLALGDSPGFVAVGGVPPELFAPAELEVMRRASIKMAAPFPTSIGA